VSLRRIEVWRGVELVVDLYELTRQFPREEIFGLMRELRRAAVAIPSDIAEGNQRHSLPIEGVS
jgi:four helix bundle protein